MPAASIRTLPVLWRTLGVLGLALWAVAAALACLAPAWAQGLASEPVAAASAPAPGSVLRDCSDCPEMVVVPAGSFTMGTDVDEERRWGVTPDYAATERPAHAVGIARPFAVSRYAITRDEWARYVAATAAASTAPAPPSPRAAEDAPAGCAVPNPRTGVWAVDPARSWRDPGFAQSGREPVVCIDWDEATHYAAWLSLRSGRHYRLLTEAEWEYAARAGTRGANYWGDDRENACTHVNASDLTRADRQRYVRSIPDGAFLCHDSYVFTAEVDAFPANAFGLYGMSGNVWQWVEDCYSSSYAGAPSDGSARAGGDCHSHIDRGASWGNSPRFVRAGSRHKDLTGARTSVLGLRVARDLSP